MTLALTVLLGGLAHGNVQGLFRLVEAARHTHAVTLQMAQTLAALTDAEDAERGYLLTGDAASLAAYRRADVRARGQWQALARLAAADPPDRRDAARLRLPLDTALAEMAAAVARRQAPGGASRPPVRAPADRSSMAAARGLLGDALAREARSWDQRQRRRSALIRKTLWQVRTLIGAEFGLLVWAYGLARRDARDQARAYEARRAEMVAQQGELGAAARDLVVINARLASASRRFEELYQALPIPCFCHDAEGRIYEWNRAFETHYALTPAQIFLRHVWDAVAAPGAEAAIRAAAARALTGEPLDDWELTLHGADGTSRHLLCNTVPMHGPEGQITGGISTHLDITDRKRMEVALHEERGFLSALLDNLQEGIAACDADGALTLFNRATREFHGLPADPLPPEAWADHYTLYHADGTTPMGAEAIPLYRAFQGERVCDSEMVIAPRGGPARTLLASGQAILDAEGRKIGAVVAMHDITRRKSVEEALRVSEERLRAFHDITAIPERGRDEKIERLLRLGCRELGLPAGAVAVMEGERYVIRHAVCEHGGTSRAPGMQIGQDLTIEDIARTHWSGADWGALCFTGDTPRDGLTPAETDFLHLIAQWIGGEVERRRSRQRASDSEERLRSAIDSMHEGFMVQDADGVVLLCNGTAERLLGVAVGETTHRAAERAAWRVVHADGSDFPRGERPTQRALATGQAQPDVTLGIERADGSITWLRMNAAPLYRAGEAAPYAAVQTFADITERRRQEDQIAAQMGQIREYNILLESQKRELEAQKAEVEMQKRILERTNLSLEVANTALESLATVDGLTGLKNHRTFQERLETEVHRAHRYGEPLSLILLDVDLFKTYNDTYGHPAGDEVLRTVGRLLDQSNRGTDLTARYGGEEFAVILPNTDGEGARTVAERLRLSIAGQAWPHRPVTASLGLSTLTPAMTERAELITAADTALYRAKRDGRNRTAHAADPTLAPSARGRRAPAREGGRRAE